MFKPGGSSRLVTGGRASSAIVDVVQRRSADRLAKLAFIVVWLTLTPTVVVVGSTVTVWWLAAVIGIAAGLVIAAVVWLLVLIWPGLRMVWWWAGEIVALAAVLAGWFGVTRVMPWWAALLVLTCIAVVPMAIPGSRRWLLAWLWCGIVRHRLRTCFATFIRVNRRGSLPLILWARPTPAGERVWVCLRPGLSLGDLTDEGGLARLAVGCWAHEVRLSRAWRRFAPLIRVDITRRNPLAATVPSPLAALVPDLVHLREQDNPVVVDAAGLDLPGVPDPAPAPATAGVKPSPRPRPGTPPAPATATADLSEWV